MRLAGIRPRCNPTYSHDTHKPLNTLAKVALEAYKDDKTAAELISAHKISSGQVIFP
jgi:hypothetical protein